jgi:hypothetical protein
VALDFVKSIVRDILSLEQPLQHSLERAKRTPRDQKCATLKDKAVEVTKDFCDRQCRAQRKCFGFERFSKANLPNKSQHGVTPFCSSVAIEGYESSRSVSRAN